MNLTAIEARAKAATLENFMRCPEDDHHCEIDGIDELNRIAREDIPALIAEVRRLERELHINPEAEIGRLNARLETEILRRDSLGETLDNVVADHKRDLARLVDIKAIGMDIVKQVEFAKGIKYPLRLTDKSSLVIRARALAAALGGE